MVAAVHSGDVTALAPIIRTLDAVRARHGEAPVHGLTRSLMLPRHADASHGWIPATEFANGSALPELLAAAHDRWPGDPHVAGALAWKSYAYWATLPAVVGFASARRVPNVAADNIRVRIHGEAPFVEFGLERPEISFGPEHPATVGDEVLLTALRETLMERHLDLVLDQFHDAVRVGRRTLLGSVASAVCYALLRASDVLPGGAVPTANAILGALDLTDLVDFGPDEQGRLTVHRRTCCLAFALPVPKVCSGCCIPTDRLPKR